MLNLIVGVCLTEYVELNGWTGCSTWFGMLDGCHNQILISVYMLWIYPVLNPNVLI